MLKHLVPLISFLLFISCAQQDSQPAYNPEADTLRYEQEEHLRNIRQLTFGGDNAEAYWSFDDSKLILQSNNPEWGVGCDQIFYVDLNTYTPGSQPPMVSTGDGRTTCSFFMPGDTTFIYASTHPGSKECPEQVSQGGTYVWPIYDSYDIFEADLNGNIVHRLTDHPGYDAEAVVSPHGDKIVFTSTRSGDLELFIMDIDGSNVRQLTNELGYDGGAFFSPDGKKLVFRASRPKTPEEQEKYKRLLADGFVEPSNMEIFTINTDGTGLTQITDLGNANWAPYFHPSGEKIIFSSNHKSFKGFPFNLFMIHTDGTGLKQISFDNTFDSFPMFSRDGKKLVFSSNRNNGGNRSTNVFIAEWVD